jgi:hypothetical protein
MVRCSIGANPTNTITTVPVKTPAAAGANRLRAVTSSGMDEMEVKALLNSPSNSCKNARIIPTKPATIGLDFTGPNTRRHREMV